MRREAVIREKRSGYKRSGREEKRREEKRREEKRVIASVYSKDAQS